MRKRHQTSPMVSPVPLVQSGPVGSARSPFPFANRRYAVSSDLLGIPPTYLPTDPATALLAETPADRVAAAHPTSSLAWAALAERSLEREESVAAYAYARTGYHRGLDALRKSG